MIQCTNAGYRLTHNALCTNCWAVPLNTTSVMSASLLSVTRRNRCVPVVSTNTKVTTRCVMPESPEDPEDPNYIDPSSPSCLAQTVEQTETYTKASSEDVLTNALISIQVFLNRYMSDIRACFLVLAVGVVVSFIMGFVFLVRTVLSAHAIAAPQDVLQVHHLDHHSHWPAALRRRDAPVLPAGSHPPREQVVRHRRLLGRPGVPLGQHHLRQHHRAGG